MIGDGEVEIGFLVGSWFLNVFINLVIDGVVLLIFYLNGVKIVNLMILVCKIDEELVNYFNGFGWEFFFIEGNDLEKLNFVMVEKMD